ncbi:MAG: hypothetical protein CVT82_03715 [Alphaproteobacteria bacterium HGW-Alphaproteobacteria-4]|nr:MAG: hypothetical protein CVT82_03715 [Alphaproteobacteria bacterium HGW-Alphaproteobacteria-4]
MRRQVKTDLRGAVAVVSLALAAGADPRAPDQGFDPALRAELAAAVAALRANRAVAAVLLRAGAGGWPDAADPLSERAASELAPGLDALADALAALGKPVVVALGGRLSAAALALAVAAGWRIAARDTVFVLPQIVLATLPGAGLMVRAARRAGAAAALRLVQPGHAIELNEALGLGLLDGVVEEGDADAAALSVAQSLATATAGAAMPPQRADGAGLGDPAAFLAEVAAARSALPQVPQPLREARARAIDCVEAALLLATPEALQFAQVAQDDLDAAPACRALTHVAAAERRVIGQIETAAANAVQRVGFWEMGSAAAPLADALSVAGFAVVLGAADEAALAEALAAVALRQQAAEAAGRISAAARAAAWARIEGAERGEGLAGCSWVLSNAEAAAALPPDLPLVLAGELAPEFAAAPALRPVAPRLVELVPPAGAPGLVATIAAVLARARITPLRTGAAPGGIAARLVARAYAAAERAVLAGARPDQVDAALGVADPLFRRADRLGLPRIATEMRALGRAPGPLILRLLADRQAGTPSTFYRGAAVPPDRAVAEVTALLPGLRAEAGIAAVPLTAMQIRARVMAELADEGAAMLQSGVALAAGDIDLAALAALGLPRASGGPMHIADTVGLLATRTLLRNLGPLGAPAPEALWDVLIRNGRRFGDLDRG